MELVAVAVHDISTFHFFPTRGWPQFLINIFQIPSSDLSMVQTFFR
jgi:hypothetical protein